MLSINLFADRTSAPAMSPACCCSSSESLVVVLTIVRRRAITVDRSAAAAIMTSVSLVGPVLMRATSEPASLLSDQVTALVSAIGLLLVVVGQDHAGPELRHRAGQSRRRGARAPTRWCGIPSTPAT